MQSIGPRDEKGLILLGRNVKDTLENEKAKG